MRRQVPLAVATLIAGAAVTAQAQEQAQEPAPDGVETAAEGRLSLGATDRFGAAAPFLYGDATARAELGDLGFELGTFGYFTPDDTPHETYAAFTWDTPEGARLSFGVPRPAYDDFAVSALDRIAPLLAVDRAALSRSQATWGAVQEGHLPYGARFEVAEGPYSFAASASRAENVDVTTAGAGMAWEDGAWTLSGAVELSSDTAVRPAVKAQLGWSDGALGAGASLYAPGAAGLPETFEGFASYDVWDALTIAGALQIPLDGARPGAAVSARYSFDENLSLSAGGASEAGGDPVFDSSLDYEF
jgi:hypothetical protein